MLKKSGKSDKMPEQNEPVTIHSIIEKTVARKGRKAKLLIHEHFKPKGGCVDARLSLWNAADLYDKVPCLPTLVIKLNKMPDLAVMAK